VVRRPEAHEPPVEETLYETGRTMIDLGLIEPKPA